MASSKMQTFSRESVILREGEVSEVMYKVIKGHVELYVGYGTEKETLLGIIGEQSWFGEFGLLLRKPAIYTVIAYDDILVLKITEDVLGDFIRDNHKSVIDIMRNMANGMLTMRYQIDLLLEELDHGNKVSDEVLKEKMRQTRQVFRQYAVCNQKYLANVYFESGNGLDKKV